MKAKIVLHLTHIYGAEGAEKLAENILNVAGLKDENRSCTKFVNKWNEQDTYIITYANSIQKENEAPLHTLHQFLNHTLKGVINTVHLLPFYPWTSDDGFSVSDYKAVAPENGSWEDVQELHKDYKVMADLVINHCSTSSEWFHNFKKGKTPGKDFFIDGSDYDDISIVVRPRSSSLFYPVETSEGIKQVWCTFSQDQVDLNFANPEVLLEMIAVIRHYMNNGVRIFRFDAIAFLWKESGTSCIHHYKTHEIIKLLRVVIEGIDSDAVIITETNVPNKENLSYFGNNDEAHLIYNFSLPPLLVYALLSGNAQPLNEWLKSMPPAHHGRAYFNFIASHDGIGLRPAEGLLKTEELNAMLETLKEFGGEISMRRMPDGDLKPYEANISLYSALAGTIQQGADDLQQQRFLCAHAVMLSIEGIPAFYIHSLLSTENYRVGVAKTGQARTINRYQYQIEDIEQALQDEKHHQKAIFEELKRLIKIRSQQPAFHPNATQYTLSLGDSLLGLWRESLDRTQSIFAVHNLSASPQTLVLKKLNLIELETWQDLLTGTDYTNHDTVTLAPYGYCWISNQ